MNVYTWDYCNLQGKEPVVGSPDLLKAGLIEGTIKQGYHITDSGKAWRAKQEARWMQEIQEIDFWSVQIIPVGRTLLGLPKGVHPIEDSILHQLQWILGTCHWMASHSEEELPGKPVQMRGFLPWKQGRVWMDMSRESPHFRGAFMRIYGAPYDPQLAWMELTGMYQKDFFPGKENIIHRVCFLEELTGS